jgi:hypothetical protein
MNINIDINEITFNSNDCSAMVKISLQVIVRELFKDSDAIDHKFILGFNCIKIIYDDGRDRIEIIDTIDLDFDKRFSMNIPFGLLNIFHKTIEDFLNFHPHMKEMLQGKGRFYFPQDHNQTK